MMSGVVPSCSISDWLNGAVWANPSSRLVFLTFIAIAILAIVGSVAVRFRARRQMPPGAAPLPRMNSAAVTLAPAVTVGMVPAPTRIQEVQVGLVAENPPVAVEALPTQAVAFCGFNEMPCEAGEVIIVTSGIATQSADDPGEFQMLGMSDTVGDPFAMDSDAEEVMKAGECPFCKAEVTLGSNRCAACGSPTTQMETLAAALDAWHLGREEELKRFLDAGETVAPHSSVLAILRALSTKKAADQKTAMKELTAHMAAYGPSPEVYFIQAVINENLNNPAKAELALTQALKLNPSFSPAVISLALHLHAKGESERAVPLLFHLIWLSNKELNLSMVPTDELRDRTLLEVCLKRALDNEADPYNVLKRPEHDVQFSKDMNMPFDEGEMPSRGYTKEALKGNNVWWKDLTINVPGGRKVPLHLFIDPIRRKICLGYIPEIKQAPVHAGCFIENATRLYGNRSYWVHFPGMGLDGNDSCLDNFNARMASLLEHLQNTVFPGSTITSASISKKGR